MFSNQIELIKDYIYAIIIIYLNTYGLNVLQLFIQGTWILTALTWSESVQVKLRQIELYRFVLNSETFYFFNHQLLICTDIITLVWYRPWYQPIRMVSFQKPEGNKVVKISSRKKSRWIPVVKIKTSEMLNFTSKI